MVKFYTLVQIALRPQFQSLSASRKESKRLLCFLFSTPDLSFALQSAARHIA